MAILHMKKNDLEGKIEGVQKIYNTYIITSIISTIVFFPVGIVVGIVWNLIYGGKFVQMKKYKKGLIGEEKALLTLSKLDDSYHIFNDMNIKYDDKMSQLDFVVVGDNGITVVESKNINGLVQGDIESHELRIKKVGRKGGVYYQSMYNPNKQVKTHVYRLGNNLKNSGMRAWATGVVFFQPKNALIFKESVNVKGAEGVFFYKEKELLANIEGKKNFITAEEKEKIINHLIYIHK